MTELPFIFSEITQLPLPTIKIPGLLYGIIALLLRLQQSLVVIGRQILI